MDDLPDLNQLQLKERESMHEFKMLVGRQFKNYTRNSKSMFMNLIRLAFTNIILSLIWARLSSGPHGI